MEEKNLKSQTIDQLLRLMITLTDEVVEMNARIIDRQLVKEKLEKLQLVQKVIMENDKSNELWKTEDRQQRPTANAAGFFGGIEVLAKAGKNY